jgi:microsomal epoxide hydrolase
VQRCVFLDSRRPFVLNQGVSLAIHLNFRPIPTPPAATPEAEKMKDQPPPDPTKTFKDFAYALEHGTRPSTVGMVVGCNPISLLAW